MTSSPESLFSVKSGAGAPSSTKSTSRRAVRIVRVSRVGERDGERLASPKEQRERIRSACAAAGFQLIDILEELDVSGGAALDHGRTEPRGPSR